MLAVATTCGAAAYGAAELNAADSGAAVAAESVAADSGAAVAALDPAPIVSVGLYKNGMAVVRRRVTPGKDAVAFVAADGHPAYGTFWQTSRDGVSVTATTTNVVRRGGASGFGDGWTEAYAGRRAEVSFVGSPFMQLPVAAALNSSAMKVRVRAPGAAREERVVLFCVTGTVERAASKPADGERLLNVRTAGGSLVAVPESCVVGVCAADGAADGVEYGAPVWRFEGAAEPFDVQYLTAGACWTPSYRLDISGDAGVLAMSADVCNEIADWNDAEVSLISGFPNLPYASVPSLLGDGVALDAYKKAVVAAEDGTDEDWPWWRGRRPSRNGGIMSQSVMLNSFAPAAVPASGAPAAEFAGAGIDIYSRPVGRRTLAKGERMAMPLGRGAVTVRRMAEWVVANDRDEWGRRKRDDEQVQEAWDMVAFANPFDFPMTTAPMEVVEDGRILGQAKVGWTNPGGETSAKITKALSVNVSYVENAVVEKESVRYRDHSCHMDRVKGEFSVRNFRGTPVAVRVKKTFSGEMSAVSEPPAKTRDLASRDGYYWSHVNQVHELTWEFTLAPGEKKDFTLDYVVYVCH